ncbi:unnamed protein product, partial [Meganyctiphanes norvegica]
PTMFSRSVYVLLLMSMVHMENQIIHNGLQVKHTKVNKPLSTSENEPCPPADVISPCTCRFSRLDCSKVLDENDLSRVFRGLNTTYLHGLRIMNNKNVTFLEGDTFGDVYFDSIAITSCALKSVDRETFIKSSETVTELLLSDNELDDTFPFGSLVEYTVLDVLIMHSNEIKSVPHLAIYSLKHLDLSWNQITSTPDDPFKHLPNLEEIRFLDCGIQDLPPNLFSSLPNLRIVYMSRNNFPQIKHNTFSITSSQMELINLIVCGVEEIDVDAFHGLSNMTIAISYNNIVTLDELVFRPLLNNDITLSLYGNELNCGCDVAWIMADSQYQNLTSNAMCSTGEWLTDLDPSWFEDNC